MSEFFILYLGHGVVVFDLKLGAERREKSIKNFFFGDIFF